MTTLDVARDERIEALAQAGYNTRQIAAVERTTIRTVQRSRARLGIAAPKAENALSAAELRRAADLLDDGASYREVARTLGRSDMTIAHHFPGRSQWPPSSSSGPGAQYRKLRKALDAIPASARRGAA